MKTFVLLQREIIHTFGTNGGNEWQNWYCSHYRKVKKGEVDWISLMSNWRYAVGYGWRSESHFVKLLCTVGQKIKTKYPFLFQYKLRTEMKLGPIIMDYCLLQFDALKISLGMPLHRGSQTNFNFFNVKPQIFQRNRKVHLSNCLESNFHNISNISLRVIRRRNYKPNARI